jgi:4-amino-4-deoxy-L-arabinose transferase-like glycosyltransferase
VIENQTGPFWYYVPVLILGFFPWIAFVPAGAVRVLDAARDRDGSFERFALSWTIVPIVFFSCAQTKLPNYIALMFPGLAIVVALWFERLADGRDRRAGIISAATIPAFVALLGLAIVLFIRSNKLDATIAVIAPQATVLAIVMLAGSLATVIALLRERTAALAPFILGATATAFVLFIAFVAEPAAEAFKPIPGFAQTILAHRTPASIVAVHDAPGAYALMFYTSPVVHTLEDGPAALDALICPQNDVYLVTRTSLAPDLERAATARGRHVEELGVTPRATLVHIDGATCVTRVSATNAS